MSLDYLGTSKSAKGGDGCHGHKYLISWASEKLNSARFSNCFLELLFSQIFQRIGKNYVAQIAYTFISL